jgi:radical SAM superfamily enzyme YgiQ (UPF0313 family)
MRILFIFKEIGLTEPLGVPYLSASLKNAGHTTKAIQINKTPDYIGEIEDFSPHILAYSFSTGFQRYILDINRRIKRRLPDALSVLGGPHSTFFPNIIKEEGVDVVCRGEGEEAMVELANAVEDDKPIKTIQNLWVKENGVVYKNPPRPLVKDLDAIPIPDRSVVFDTDEYLRDAKIKHFLNTRGCPYNCSYCFNHALEEIYRKSNVSARRVRFHSVDRVIEEVNQVKDEYGLELVRFVSDIFVLSRDWLREFAERFPAEVGLPFSCNVRANLIDDEVAGLMKKAGCISVLMGVESADDEMRNEILCRKMSKDTIRSAADALHRNDINIYSQNIVGLPGETFKMALETMKFNSEIGAEFAWVSIFMPYPGTRLGQYAVDEGYFDGDYNKLDYNLHSTSSLTFKNPGDKQRIENLHKLFSVGASFPALQDTLQEMSNLPLNPLYRMIFRMWYGFAMHHWIFPIKLGFKDFLNSIVRFVRKDEG